MARPSIALFLATAGLMAGTVGCSNTPEPAGKKEDAKSSLTPPAPSTPATPAVSPQEKKGGEGGEGEEGGEGGEN